MKFELVMKIGYILNVNSVNSLLTFFINRMNK